MNIHVVKAGDSIYKISQQYNISPEKIISDNAIENPTALVIGQSLVIDTPQKLHTVSPGESIYQIARQYGLSTQDIIKNNPQITNSIIYPGQVLTIKQGKLGEIEVNGYAYPVIKMDILEKTLKYLTYLSIFSYEVNADGNLDLINDEPLIQAARNQNVAPIMVITNKEFSSYVASQVLNNNDIQTKLLENIVYVLKTKKYYGLNIDFEYLYPRDREAYNKFLKRTVELLEPMGYPVFTAVAPKNTKDQKGILYEALDYKAHGEIVDRVILMTYEWGYTYGPPLAVAPLNEVKKVLDYAVTVIPPDKILMGIPNYGYDWELPWMMGDAAKTISNTGAVTKASNTGSIIKFDEKAKSPYFNYYGEDGKLHIVWFDDARSIESKLLLIDKYNLAGASYWSIGRFFPQNWLILSSLYNIKKIL